MFSKSLQTIFNTAKSINAEAKIVGGAVRDFLLKNTPIESGDIDISINAPVEEVKTAFARQGYKVITKYATNIVVIRGRGFEVTSTRKDENCDGRHANMVFTPSFEEDAQRRDFTINALYMNETGKVEDYTNGVADIQKKIVRFIGNPEHRIREDYLRIWRFFRFSCLYAEGFEEEGLNACIKMCGESYPLSKERTTNEMLKMMQGSPEKIKTTIAKMLKIGLLKGNWNLQFNSLPSNSLLAMLVLTLGAEQTGMLFTAFQKKVISNLQKAQQNGFIKAYYLMQSKEDFTNILTLAQHLTIAIPNVDFAKMPQLNFTNTSIMQQGFTGKQISEEFAKKLDDFIKQNF